MNTMTPAAELKSALMPDTIFTMIWSLIIPVPMLFVIVDSFKLGTPGLVIGILVTVNASVGLSWLLGGLASLFTGGIGEMLSASSGNTSHSSSDDSTLMVNPATGLEMEDGLDSSGRSMGES